MRLRVGLFLVFLFTQLLFADSSVERVMRVFKYKCPMVVSSNIIMTDVVVLPDKVEWEFNIRGDVLWLAKTRPSNFRRMLVSSRKNRKFATVCKKDNGRIFVLKFFDSVGNYIISVVIPPEE